MNAPRMTFTAKAGGLLKMIDPIIGVAGKGAEVTFNLAESMAEVSIADDSESALCRMYADIPRSGIISEWDVGRDRSVTLSIDQLTAGLKAFGPDEVEISYSEATRQVSIENNAGRRTMRTLGAVRTSRDIQFRPCTEIKADPADLKKACAFDRISDSMSCTLEGGRLSIGCSSESETAEIYIDTDVRTKHRSFYSSRIVSEIFRRIHAEGPVSISLCDDAPLCLSFDYDCARFYIFVAPRIESV